MPIFPLLLAVAVEAMWMWMPVASDILGSVFFLVILGPSCRVCAPCSPILMCSVRSFIETESEIYPQMIR